MNTTIALAVIFCAGLLCLAYWVAYRDDKRDASFRAQLQPGHGVYFQHNRKPHQGRVVKVFSEYVHIKDAVDNLIYSVPKKNVYRLS